MDVARGVTFLSLELVSIALVLLELESLELARSDDSQWLNPELGQWGSWCVRSAQGQDHCAARDVSSDSLVAIRFPCTQKRHRLRGVLR